MKRRAVFSIRLIGLLVLLFVEPSLVTTIADPVITSNGPYGGQIYKIVIDPVSPNTLYAAASDGGVFNSTDSGSRWSAVNVGLTNLSVRALAINPATSSTLYAGTYNGGGVFRSTNNGAHWTAAGLADKNILVLIVDPNNVNTVYVGGWTAYTRASTAAGVGPISPAADLPA